MSQSIETILLSNDRRQISALRSYLSPDYCDQAARLVLAQPGKVIITTGFYIPSMKMPETDGPPGALAIGDALSRLDHPVAYVTDRYTAPLLRTFASPGQRVVDFPITNEIESEAFASHLLQETHPCLLIAVERCGLTRQGIYLNCRGADISAYNARIDALFHSEVSSIGIGDGGNEIGMGSLAEVIPSLPGLPKEPCVTRTTALIAACVSNWGAYGLLAALSRQTGIDLLPSTQAEIARIQEMVAFGACDGVLSRQSDSVDGYSLQENSCILDQLSASLAQDTA